MRRKKGATVIGRISAGREPDGLAGAFAPAAR
jgi:hypothetical protein